MAVGLEDLLKAGVHFGHQTRRWNPKMRRYIFAERGGIYIIDLKKTLHELERAKQLIREVVHRGDSVLFVCTKTQLSEIVRAEAERCGGFYVTVRWLGGMLTNFQTIKKNIRRLKELERGVEEGAFEFYTKKERLLLDREREKLDRFLSGIKNMARQPGCLFVVDARKEAIAVAEANKLGIPVVAIADTNADPDLLTVPIAGNDDAIRSVSLITQEIADTVAAAMAEVPEELRKAAAEEEEEVFTYSSDGAVGAVSERESGGRRSRKRRRPRPEVIAAHRGPGEAEGGDVEGAEEERDEGGSADLEEDAGDATGE
ncbi:MAG: 30S ribosomal protein S2 [Gemmatimonadota bacterium]|nr:MAG: 30S ribosomal protein S2 [Gemmatimonadota bacterium]